jgi:biotin carboxyl carrier protein
VNGTAGKTLVAPMPGNVLKVLVAEGEKVTKDQPVLVFEAMKMENNLTAPADGTIVTLNVKEGSVMSVGDVLLVIE